MVGLKILVDTNIIIDFLRRKDKKNSRLELMFNDSSYTAVISSVTVSELYAGQGMDKETERHDVEQLIAGMEILFPDFPIAQLTGEIMRKLNYNIDFEDSQIAATALYQNLPLLTFNTKDFKRIKGLKLAP